MKEVRFIFVFILGIFTNFLTYKNQCHDNQSRSESHLALARARFLVADAGEYFSLVLSLQRLPTQPIELTEAQMEEVEKILDLIESDDDVQAVFTNLA